MDTQPPSSNRPPTALATSSNRLPNRLWGRLSGPFPSTASPRRRAALHRLNDQVVKLSDFKRVAEEAEATLSDANRQVQKLEEEVAWLMLSSRRRCQSPGGSTSPGGDDAQVVNADFPGGALLHGAEPDTVLDKWRAERQALEEAVRAREQEVRDLDAAARAREQQLTDLEGAVRACEAEVRAQAAELEQLRELRDTNAARIKELEAGKKTASCPPFSWPIPPVAIAPPPPPAGMH